MSVRAESFPTAEAKGPRISFSVDPIAREVATEIVDRLGERLDDAVQQLDDPVQLARLLHVQLEVAFPSGGD